jgi:hypothetical protein
MDLRKSWKHRLPCGLMSVPLPKVVERGDRHGLTPVEADERRIHQLADLHHRG